MTQFMLMQITIIEQLTFANREPFALNERIRFNLYHFGIYVYITTNSIIYNSLHLNRLPLRPQFMNVPDTPGNRTRARDPAS